MFLENTIAPDFSGLTKVSTYIFDLSVSKYLEQATNQEQAIQGEKERERESTGKCLLGQAIEGF